MRTTRFTFGLLEEEPFFTLNVLPEAHKQALQLCGTSSGRDIDKWEATGLTHRRSARVPVPRVSQAELALECRVVAVTDLRPDGFLEEGLVAHYPAKDYHRVYFGEVVAAWRG